ncbi:hypothetical protein [Bosea sp. UNC402CLCol]|uniref:hypothetical protein n=1 Tax=Bosea sp. UNC402CLCol TaxID=1510531 RepID=UPI0012DFF282|nr:hypothetical protein [Bosea sp. UNC402CLCol]
MDNTRESRRDCSVGPCRFTLFVQANPLLESWLSRIDIVAIQQTGATFYTIRVSVLAEEYARLAPQRVTAGMQADVFVQTEDRTPFEYIVRNSDLVVMAPRPDMSRLPGSGHPALAGRMAIPIQRETFWPTRQTGRD